MELAGIGNVGAGYLSLTFRELEIIAKAHDKQKWIQTATNAFYSNANIRPSLPIDVIPSIYRDKPRIEKVDVEVFFAELDRHHNRIHNKK